MEETFVPKHFSLFFGVAASTAKSIQESPYTMFVLNDKVSLMDLLRYQN